MLAGDWRLADAAGTCALCRGVVQKSVWDLTQRHTVLAFTSMQHKFSRHQGTRMPLATFLVGAGRQLWPCKRPSKESKGREVAAYTQHNSRGCMDKSAPHRVGAPTGWSSTLDSHRQGRVTASTCEQTNVVPGSPLSAIVDRWTPAAACFHELQPSYFVRIKRAIHQTMWCVLDMPHRQGAPGVMIESEGAGRTPVGENTCRLPVGSKT